MCSGQERFQLLREAYQMGFKSGQAQALADIQEGTTAVPDNVLDLDSRRVAKTERRAVARPR